MCFFFWVNLRLSILVSEVGRDMKLISNCVKLLIITGFLFSFFWMTLAYCSCKEFSVLQITLPYETQQLSRATRETAAIYLACGIDTSKVVLAFFSTLFGNVPYARHIGTIVHRWLWFIMQASVFVQSHVRAHVELMWLLSSATPIGWLNRMIQFKEKSRKAVRV